MEASNIITSTRESLGGSFCTSKQDANFHILVSDGSGTRAIMYASATGGVVITSQSWTSSRFPQFIPGARIRYIKEESRTDRFEGVGEEKLLLVDRFLAKHDGGVAHMEHSQHDIDQETEAFLDRVYGLQSKGQARHAIDVVFQHMNRLLMEGRFEDCDEILSRVELRRIPPMIMAAFLTITAAARKELKNRPVFFENVRLLVEAERGPEDAKRLLVGLR